MIDWKSVSFCPRLRYKIYKLQSHRRFQDHFILFTIFMFTNPPPRVNIFFFWIYLWMKVYACCKIFIFSEVAARNALQKQGPENVDNIMSGRKNPSKIHVKRLIFSRVLLRKDFLHRLFSKDLLQELHFHWLLLHFHSKTHLSWT